MHRQTFHIAAPKPACKMGSERLKLGLYLVYVLLVACIILFVYFMMVSRRIQKVPCFSYHPCDGLGAQEGFISSLGRCMESLFEEAAKNDSKTFVGLEYGISNSTCFLKTLNIEGERRRHPVNCIFIKLVNDCAFSSEEPHYQRKMENISDLVNLSVVLSKMYEYNSDQKPITESELDAVLFEDNVQGTYHAVKETSDGAEKTADCSPLPHPAFSWAMNNTEINKSGWVLYECNPGLRTVKGFTLQNVTCGENGSWTPELFDCDTCSDPPQEFTDLGLITSWEGTPVKVNQSVTYNCKFNSLEEEDRQHLLCTEHGWNASNLKSCLECQGDPPTPEEYQELEWPNNHEIYAIAVYRCPPQMAFSSGQTEEVSMCTFGKWKPNKMKPCSLCVEPPPIIAGAVPNWNYTTHGVIGTRVSYNCQNRTEDGDTVFTDCTYQGWTIPSGCM